MLFKWTPNYYLNWSSNHKVMPFQTNSNETINSEYYPSSVGDRLMSLRIFKAKYIKNDIFTSSG